MFRKIEPASHSSPTINPRPRTRPTLSEQQDASATPNRQSVNPPHRIRPSSPVAEQRPNDVVLPVNPTIIKATNAKAVGTEPKFRIEMIDGKPKRRATGNHKTGYCRTSVDTQFKEGNKGGGRRKGSKSQATLEREALNKKYPATVNGRKQMKAARALITDKMVLNVLKNDNYRDQRDLCDRAARLHPDEAKEQGRGVYDPAADLAVLEQLTTLLGLGEPEKSVDPLADLATGRPDLGEPSDGDGWSEGDWNSNYGEDSDDDV